jgi:hypothetical protein
MNYKIFRGLIAKDHRIWIGRLGATGGLGWRHWTLVASHAMAWLIGESRKRDSGHDFGSGFA